MTLHVGDTSPALTGTATTAGAAANLTSATLELHVQRPDQTIFTVTPAAVSAVDGTWSYTWQAGDLTVAGRWVCELQVTWVGGGIQTFGPVAFFVVPEIPPTTSVPPIDEDGFVLDGGVP